MVAVIFIVIGAIIGAGWMLVFDRLGTKGSIIGFFLLLPALALIAFVVHVLALD